MLTLTLEVAQPGRLDLLLLEKLRESLALEISRSRLKEFFAKNAVLLDGRAADASLWLESGRHEVSLPDERELQAASAPRARPSKRGPFLPVVYEDADLLVLHKPSGVPSAPLEESETETAVGAALAFDPRIAQVSRVGFSGKRGELDPGLLHRLDTGTSGLLAFARTIEAFERLRSAWKSGGVHKIYRALAAPPSSRVTMPQAVKLTLGHDARSSKRMLVLNDRTVRLSQIRGKPLESVTRIVSVQPVNVTYAAALCDYEIEIETGVMHQIRCTLAHLGSPIWGDPIYGGQPSQRLWLHAWKLALPLPGGGQLCLESKLPEDWPAPKTS